MTNASTFSVDGASSRPIDQLDVAADLVRGVCRAEAWNNDPSHDDFYAYGGTLTQLLAALADLAGKLARQIEGYRVRHRLRDDEGQNPDHRIAVAVVHLADVAAALNHTAHDVSTYHSAIGHIAVADDHPAGGGCR